MKSLLHLIPVILLLSCPGQADTTKIFIGWDGTRYHAPDDGHRIGLALSGGGSRGLAQVGVLKAFEEAGLKVEAIAGTSIGGLVGGLYACGYSAEDLEDIVKTLDFSELFSNRPKRTSMLLTQRPEMERFLISVRFDGLKPYIPQALTTGQKLSDFLTDLTLRENYLSGGDFGHLRIPFCAATTDIVTGNEVILSKGILADAMRSTMAFPLAFTGIEAEDMILMDGGLVDPIPVNIVRNMIEPAIPVVAVNTTSDLMPKNEIRGPMDIANQVTSIMSMDKRATALESADIVITPAISGYDGADFERIGDLIELGYFAGLDAIPEIMGKIGEVRSNDSLYITEVSITTISPDVGKEAFIMQTGLMITRGELEKMTAERYRQYDLFSISTEVQPGEDTIGRYSRASLKIEMTPKPNADDLVLSFRGNSIFDDSTLTDIIKGGRELFSSEDIISFSDSLESLYGAKGCDLAHVSSIDYDPPRNLLEISIDEAIVEEIRVIGNRRTKNWLIRSNLSLKKGETINSGEVRNGIANLFATDLFERVTVGIMPAHSGADVRVSVKEKKYTQLRLGWRWDDEYRSEEFVELLDNNLFGTGQEILAHAQYAKRRQKYEISMKADRFFSTYLTYKARGFYNILDRKLYDRYGESDSSYREDRYGFEFMVGQQIARFGTVTAEIGWSEIKSKYHPGDVTDRLKLRTLTLRSLVETIDKYPLPNSGKKHLIYIQQSTDILGGEKRFTKLFSSIESYFAFRGRFNFHPRISAGITETEGNIPLPEKFYMGGHYSFYGYRTNEMSGDQIILGNMELRYKLPFRLYLSGRYDLGEVFDDIDDIRLKNVHHAYGLSLIYSSPVGPIDFGYGKSGSHDDCWYIDIGLAF